ncbi:MAG: hypothetical protein DLM55_09670 [Acidimicrobiales bacterium]|nr:MAG: hypothetical protein DLM55_09670 [Acidimicrobiales bacterium]
MATSRAGQQQQSGAVRSTARAGWSLIKKLILGLVLLAVLGCSICFMAVFGVPNIMSLLMQTKCEQQFTPGGANGGNVAVPDINKNPPPALGGTKIAGETFSAEQVRNAWIILDVAKQRKLPEKAWLIAMVTARKESTYTNVLVPVDHDSLGVFQQRPSAGWGTPQQLTDVWYAANAFFGGPQPPSNTGLVDVPGWENMEIQQAAEAVQHSAFGSAENYNRFLAVAQGMLSYLGSPVAGVPIAGGASGGNCASSVVGGLRGRIVQLAQNEVGYRPTGEGCVKYSDPNWLPYPQGAPDAQPCQNWCATFVQAIWKRAGVNPASLFGTVWAQAIPTEVMRSGGAKGTFKPKTPGKRDGNPQPGDALIYGVPTEPGQKPPGQKETGHVGIVVNVYPDGSIDTVEGNSGNGVGRVSLNKRLDPITLNNGSPATQISGYVTPPGG